MIEFLQKITGAFGPAGEEKIVKDIIRSEIDNFCQDIREDKLGNMIVYQEGETDKDIMVAAHADEIGLMVTHIDEEGFLRFTPVGGLRAKWIPQKSFIFSDGIVGTVGVEEEKKNDKKLKFEDMYLDIGAENREKAEELVKIGDTAVYSRNFVEAGGRIIANSLDDRAGCALLVKLIQEMEESPHNIHYVFTVQEEVGCRGAKTAAYDIEPDAALAVDVTATGDTPGSKKREVSLGEGTAIKVMDRGSITDTRIKNLLTELAKKNEISYQYEVLEAGATDAHTIQLSRGGVPSGTVSIPCRYIHSPGEMIDMDDMNRSFELIKNFLQSKDLAKITG